MKNPLKSRSLSGLAARLPRKTRLLQVIVLLGLGYALAVWMGGGEHSKQTAATPASEAAQPDQASTTWTCSMHPQIRQPNAGDCPICGMDLIPVTETTGGMRTLTVSPEARALMSIETAPVERRYVSHEIRMVGKVDYDETQMSYITARVSGRLDRLYVDYEGIEVREGDHLAHIYSEELYSAQQELIQAARLGRDRRRSSDTGGINLLDSAREKLRLLGLKDEQIQAIEKQDTPSTHLTIYSPVSGVVIEKLKREGERVKVGDRIYTIADLNLVWVRLDAYESDLSWIRYGQDATITTEAYPGDEFHGRISFIQPVLNDATRTVKVRVNVPNVDGKLKPEMFVRATVRPKVAAGGRVMDPSLAGKWISPMHPEIIKDEPGECDICGMPLVRAESLGYVAPEMDEQEPPLVIPYSAVLPTGTRAVVYVELPEMHSAAEPAFQTLSSLLESGNLDEIRQAFADYGRMLDRPYDQPGTQYAKRLWSNFADQLGQHALTGQRAETVSEVERIFGQVQAVMSEVREEFALPGQPTFEGREIVLGPRAADFYLVRHGLEEGEMVVRQGNFKLDSEIQIRAQPSMMTPEGGGDEEEHAGHEMTLPGEFQQQIRDLYDAYDQVTEAVEAADLADITAAFDQLQQTLSQVDGSQLTGHPRMAWKEFSMLLGNDAAEGQQVERMDEADRVYLLLKRHMRQLRQQLHVPDRERRKVERIAVSPEFQTELARVWEGYRAVQRALAADEFQTAREAIAPLETALNSVDPDSLTDAAAKEVWEKEEENLKTLLDELNDAQDIQALRETFRPLSEEIGVLAKAFGFGETSPVYEIHCPMAFQNQGAIWYQADDDVRNPYFGATMLKCADRVERVER